MLIGVMILKGIKKFIDSILGFNTMIMKGINITYL